MNSTDAELAELFRQGHEHAFDELARRHLPAHPALRRSGPDTADREALLAHLVKAYFHLDQPGADTWPSAANTPAAPLPEPFLSGLLAETRRRVRGVSRTDWQADRRRIRLLTIGFLVIPLACVIAGLVGRQILLNRAAPTPAANPAYIDELRRQLEQVAAEKMPAPDLAPPLIALHIPANQRDTLASQLPAIITDLGGTLAPSTTPGEWLATLPPGASENLRLRLDTLATALGGTSTTTGAMQDATFIKIQEL